MMTLDPQRQKFIIYNGICFNVVESDAWREMIKAVAAAGPTYMPVSRYALATNELEKQRAVNRRSTVILSEHVDCFEC
jgi:hypothetical protein